MGADFRYLAKWFYEARYAAWSGSVFRFEQEFEEEDLTPTTLEEWRYLCMQEPARDRMAMNGII